MNLAASCPNLSSIHSVLKSYTDTKISIPALTHFRQLLQSSLKPKDLTISSLIKACASSSSSSQVEANLIHAHLIKSGFHQFVHISTALLDYYANLGCVSNAHNVFDDMPERDVVAWNALICGYSRNGYDYNALGTFVLMLRNGFSPNQRTLVGLVPSFGRGEVVAQGKCIHGFGIKAGLDFDSRVKNALTTVYAKCGDLESAEVLFDEIADKTVVSWNAMIGAYGQNGFSGDAMLVFKRMIEEGFRPNSVTIVSLLSANAIPKPVHCHAIKTGIIHNISVITSLVCGYARCGSSESSVLLYESHPVKNLVSLTAIITSYVEKGDMGLVLSSFAQMQQLDMKLDAVAMASLLRGIQNQSHFEIGLAFHGYGFKTGLCLDYLVANGLVSMYSRFNDTQASLSLLFEMQEKPLISWNSVISVCAQSGKARVAIQLFSEMWMTGQRPDAITVSSLLSCCSQLSYLQFGKRLHNFILRNKMETEEIVGTALLDMYTKCGRLDIAEKVFNSIKIPCLATWNSMISAYSLYGFEHKSLLCYSEMLEQGLKPDEITFLGVLASCTHRGLVHEGKRYFKIMTEEFGISPTLQHYACIIGLLGRAGLFEEALVFITNMEIDPDSSVLGALLNACCIHQELKLGEYLAKKLFLLDHRNSGFYVLMSNLYAANGRWDDAARVREIMRDSEDHGSAGISQIELTSLEDMNASSINSPEFL